MANNRQAGKHFEKVMAEKLGARRVGIFGKEDLEHPLFSIECKKRKAFIGQKFMTQCVKNCPENKTPLVVVHVTGKRHDDDLVMMRFADWQDWHGMMETCKQAEEIGL